MHCELNKIKNENLKEEILNLIEKTRSIIPSELEDDLEIESISKQPKWHSFEHQIWKNGEEIRQKLLFDKKLKKDEEVFDKLLTIATNRYAKRGRQSFILLFGSVKYIKYSSELIKHINDGCVNGQVIDTIYKMRVCNYVEEIKPFCNSPITWIKNIAKKYIEKYDS